MLKNLRIENDEVKAEAHLTLFNGDVNVMLDDASHAGYAETCISYFNSLDEAMIKKLCEASIRYCNYSLDSIGEELKNFHTPTDVLRLVTPNCFVIPDPGNRDEPVIHLELDCEWEIEHGMEWVVRRDQILYVGSFNGNDPWGDFTKKVGWNYA